MTVKELIEKLRKYPMDGELDCRDVGVIHKGVDCPKLMILVVGGHELDPVFQFTGPFQRGYGAADRKEKADAASR
jgi:hypothetical protein